MLRRRFLQILGMAPLAGAAVAAARPESASAKALRFADDHRWPDIEYDPTVPFPRPMPALRVPDELRQHIEAHRRLLEEVGGTTRAHFEAAERRQEVIRDSFARTEADMLKAILRTYPT